MLRVAICELFAHDPLLTLGALVITDWAMLRVAICELDAHDPRIRM